MSSFFRSPNDITSSSESEDSAVVDEEASERGAPAIRISTSVSEGLSTSCSVASEGQDDRDLETDLAAAAASISLGASPVDAEIARPPTKSASTHDSYFRKDVLLHSLLEERALRTAVNHFNTVESPRTGRYYTADDPEVKHYADSEYQFMAAQLGAHGLIPAGLEREELREERQAYIQGLDHLSSLHVGGYQAPLAVEEGTESPSSLPRILSRTALASSFRHTSFLSPNQSRQPSPSRNHNSLVLSRQNSSNNIRKSIVPARPASPPAPRTYASIPRSVPTSLEPFIDPHQVIHTSRYQKDFVEISLLGKGGYGRVFQAEHKLDGVHYAVKKIPLSPARLQKIHERGQAEVDKILNELRTFARLEHPNLVRYHNGWLEFVDDKSQRSLNRPDHGVSRERLLITGPPQTHLSREDNIQAPGKLKDLSFDDTSPGRKEFSIIFEDSKEQTGQAAEDSDGSKEVDIFDFEDTDFEEPPVKEPPKRPTAYHSRHQSLPSLKSTGRVSSPQISPHGYHLTLHIQMSLHPLTLADYISTQQEVSPRPARGFVGPQRFEEQLRPRHCFHTKPSLRILEALLNGVEYLHEQGVVHRDLKPSNIFLTPSTHRTPGCIELGDCGRCSSRTPACLQVRIGDFGLVTAIAQPGAVDAPAPAPPGHAVGTEFYRPPTAAALASEKLDVFALGVVFFELLWPFQTRMERHETLHKVKRGQLPASFAGAIGGEGPEVAACITGMLAGDEGRRLSCQQVRRNIEKLLCTCDAQGAPEASEVEWYGAS